jgi:5-formyltetrahydrofolate cyclo-ligase
MPGIHFMPNTKPSKAELRATLRQRRQALGPQQQRTAAQSLITSITKLPAWDKAERVALYMAADGEISTGPLQQLATRQGKQLLLPVIADDNSLSFHAWEADEPLRDNRYNIPEPPAQALRCPINDLDIIFMPLVAWDQCGGRLGMGGGFYDRTLAGADGPVLVGLAHECQQVGQVPRDSWDICLAFIATDTALHQCPGA